MNAFRWRIAVYQGKSEAINKLDIRGWVAGKRRGYGVEVHSARKMPDERAISPDPVY